MNIDERRAQLEQSKRVTEGAETLIAFFRRHGGDEPDDTINAVGGAISMLVEYGHALAEGRVQPRPPKPAPDRPRLAIVDGGKPKD